jgi:hypothetical protein
MAANNFDPVATVSKRLSDLYAGLEDFVEEDSAENLLKVLVLIRDLRLAMRLFDRFAVAGLRQRDVSWSEIAAGLSESREEVWRRFQLSEGEFGAAEDDLAALLTASIPGDDVVLVRGNVYTRNDLRRIFEIRDATINNGVFHFKERHEVWIFVTENKQADREQYVDKLIADVLHWQGQRMGRTDSLILDHKRTGEKILLFYRLAKYQFDGAGFRYEGHFDYLGHSGGQPTNFVLERATS